MAKRGKKSSTVNKTKKHQAKSNQKVSGILREEKVEKALIQNFVAIQKVMVDIGEKFEKLTKQISELLELFESAAKSLAEKEVKSGESEKKNKEIIEKLNTLLEQNKIIARGLTLLHEGAISSHHAPSQQKSPNQPIQKNAIPPQVSPATIEMSAPQKVPVPSPSYHKSIIGGEPEEENKKNVQ